MVTAKSAWEPSIKYVRKTFRKTNISNPLSPQFFKILKKPSSCRCAFTLFSNHKDVHAIIKTKKKLKPWQKLKWTFLFLQKANVTKKNHNLSEIKKMLNCQLERQVYDLTHNTFLANLSFHNQWKHWKPPMVNKIA